ncbi:MAG: LysR family transcriptional regulator [Paucibacter sp.]|nr:LysR family transcriptional regulator [Roseateles sp.]
MDRIAAMTAFVRVVEAGTFTKAADTLNLPNATVTRLIQSLEEELRVRLLHRTTRRVTVTPEGATYYERVVRLLAELSDIESSASQSMAKPSGKVKVETAPNLAAMVLVPALHEFYREYPDVDIEMGSSNKHADLVGEGIDCVIRAGAVNEQLMVARRIGSLFFTTCATPEFIKRHGAPQRPEDLMDLPTVGLITASSGGRATPFRFNDGNTELTISPPHKLLVNDTNTYVAAGVAGLGVVRLPSYAAVAAVRSGALVPVLREWDQGVMPVHVLYAPNRFLSAKVRVFIDWVAALFEQHEQLRRT